MDPRWVTNSATPHPELDQVFCHRIERRRAKVLAFLAVIFLAGLFEISLMIFFGAIKRPRGSDFRHYGVA